MLQNGNYRLDRSKLRQKQSTSKRSFGNTSSDTTMIPYSFHMWIFIISLLTISYFSYGFVESDYRSASITGMAERAVPVHRDSELFSSRMKRLALNEVSTHNVRNRKEEEIREKDSSIVVFEGATDTKTKQIRIIDSNSRLFKWRFEPHSKIHENVPKLLLHFFNRLKKVIELIIFIPKRTIGGIIVRSRSVYNTFIVSLFRLQPFSEDKVFSSPSVEISDRLGTDVNHIRNAHFTEARSLKVASIYEDIVKNKPDIVRLASQIRYPITPHLVYRYYISSNWMDQYNGFALTDAIVNTITWRHRFGVHELGKQVRNSPISCELVAKGFNYVSTKADAKKRAIVVLKVGQIDFKNLNEDDILKLFIYTIDRASQKSVDIFHSGEFIAIVDLAKFNRKNSPSFSFLKSIAQLLKLHYPYRFTGLYLVNAPPTFGLLWNILRPLIPSKVQKMTFVLGDVKKKNVKKVK